MIVAKAADNGQSRLLKNSCHRTRPIMVVLEPPNKSGITNSPTAGIKTSKLPVMMPGMVSGKVIRKNATQGFAPKSEAACSNVQSNLEIDTYSGKIMKGR